MATTRAFQLITLFNKTLLFFAGLGLAFFALPNPVFSFPLLIFVVFVPLFFLSRELAGWRLFGLNFFYMFIGALGMTFPFDFRQMVFVWPEPLFLLTPILLAVLVYAGCSSLAISWSKRVGWQFSPLILGVGWVLAHYLLSHLPLVFPLSFETALVPVPIFIQSARLLSSYFLVFLIIVTNGILAEVFRSLTQRNLGLVPVTVYVSLIIIHIVNLAYGAFTLAENSPKQQVTIPIAIIQPNVSFQDYLLRQRSHLFKRYFDEKVIYLSKLALESRPKLIIWPELAGDYIMQNDEYLNRLGKEISAKGAELLVGTSYLDYSQKRQNYNIAFLLKGNGDTSEIYQKARLFAFSETGFYAKGGRTQALVSDSGVGKIGVMICLESFYPWLAKDLKKQGANILVLISNDASLGNSIIPYLHKNLMALRAIENNCYGLHVGNTGPSVVFDACGRVVLEIPQGKAGWGTTKLKV